jgi:hypothetical protein
MDNSALFKAWYARELSQRSLVSLPFFDTVSRIWRLRDFFLCASFGSPWSRRLTILSENGFKDVPLPFLLNRIVRDPLFSEEAIFADQLDNHVWIGQERTLWRVTLLDETQISVALRNPVVALAGSSSRIFVDHSDYSGGDMHIAVVDRASLEVLHVITGCTSQLAGFQMGGFAWIGPKDEHDSGWLVRRSRPNDWSDFELRFELRGFRVDDSDTSFRVPAPEQEAFSVHELSNLLINMYL